MFTAIPFVVAAVGPTTLMLTTALIILVFVYMDNPATLIMVNEECNHLSDGQSCVASHGYVSFLPYGDLA